MSSADTPNPQRERCGHLDHRGKYRIKDKCGFCLRDAEIVRLRAERDRAVEARKREFQTHLDMMDSANHALRAEQEKTARVVEALEPFTGWMAVQNVDGDFVELKVLHSELAAAKAALSSFGDSAGLLPNGNTENTPEAPNE